MATPPRAHLVQLDIAWEDKPANHAKVERLLDKADPTPGDFILLPEMFDTGFSLNTDRTADADGETFKFLSSLAADLGCWVQGGRTIRPCHSAHASNVMTVFSPQGEPVLEYAKIHPFSFGREQEKFAGGTEVKTWDWPPSPGATARPSAASSAASLGSAAQSASSPSGPTPPTLRICPAICYDLRFPELFRLGLLQGAECYAIGACWPEARQHHWRSLLIARAIENQAFVLGVNRTGREPDPPQGGGLVYAGGSIAVGPTGEVLGELGRDEGVLSVSLVLGALHEWRERFPAWRDVKLLEGGSSDPSARGEIVAALSAQDIRCPNCGYLLRGLASPKCPECGLQITLAMVRPPLVVAGVPLIPLTDESELRPTRFPKWFVALAAGLVLLPVAALVLFVLYQALWRWV